MLKNMVVPYIEVERSKYGNLHAFEIVNEKWEAKKHSIKKTGNFLKS